MQLTPVILSGGAGTRLWPLSTSARPKQLLPLLDTHTLLQQTLLRLVGLSHQTAPLVVASAQHRFLVAEQLHQLGFPDAKILLEPMGRNTAPAIALAALQARTAGEDPILLVLPSDHAILSAERFRTLITQALPLAQAGKLVTFGIRPESPHTGYGYIRAGSPCLEGIGYDVAAFVEKPDLAHAQAYLASGDYTWNSGMFLLKASAYLEELERLRPEILLACRETLLAARHEHDFIWLDPVAFALCPADSIDYAVMEHTQAAAVLPAEHLGWSDIGSWTALAELSSPDAQGNVAEGNVLALDSHGCYLRSTGRLIAVLGLEDLIVVETPDAVLVAPRARAQEVKRLAERAAVHSKQS